MSIKATFTSLNVGLTRAESSQLSLQLCPSSDKSKENEGKYMYVHVEKILLKSKLKTLLNPLPVQHG